jgi:hypothetical protein
MPFPSAGAAALAEALARDGFAIVPGAIPEAALQTLERALERFAAEQARCAGEGASGSARRRGGVRPRCAPSRRRSSGPGPSP